MKDDMSQEVSRGVVPDAEKFWSKPYITVRKEA